MKKIILTTQCFLILVICNSQVPSSCAVPNALLTNYKTDVRHLTIQRLIQINSPYKDSIAIPQIYQDSIWQGLSAIYNVNSILESDTVFDLFCIHTYPNSYSTCHGLRVSVNSAFSWTTQWQNLQIVTGYSALDNLMTTYGFTITNYYSWNLAIITTTQEINMEAFKDSLLTLDGIVAVNPSVAAGAGDYLTYNSDGINKDINFVMGFDDCPSGCMAHYTWKFRVYQDCSVEYLGAIDINPYNTPFPVPLNCNISNIENPTNQKLDFVTVFPNPTYDYLNINSTQIVDFKICDISGRSLKIGTVTKETIVSLTDLSEGLYFIDFVDKANDLRKTIKIIKY
jgi:hypothetical protein